MAAICHKSRTAMPFQSNIGQTLEIIKCRVSVWQSGSLASIHQNLWAEAQQYAYFPAAGA
jgi:hypothetical protein